MRHLAMAPAVVTLFIAAAVPATGQPSTPVPMPIPPPAAPTRAGDPPMTSLEVQVVITRLDRGKVVSTLPYTLAVTSNAGEAQLNMGADVPVPMMAMAAPPATPSGATATGAGPSGSPAPVRMPNVNYRPIGTVITCRASTSDDKRYQLALSVDDSAVFTSGQAAPPIPVGDAIPVFRSFRSRNTLMMTDGQTRQYTAATDRVTGEVVRVEVTLRVVK